MKSFLISKYEKQINHIPYLFKTKELTNPPPVSYNSPSCHIYTKLPLT